MLTLLEEIKSRHPNRPAGDVLLTSCAMDENRFIAGKSGAPDESVAIVNTGAVDLADEVVVPGGADKTYFERFAAVYWCHDSYRPPVGGLRRLERRSNPDRWAMAWTWAKDEFAQAIKVSVQDGIIRGTSIGFVADDRGTPTDWETRSYGMCRSIVRKWTWLETSITPQPCNPDAVIGMKGMPELEDETIHGIEKLVGKGRISKAMAYKMGVPVPKPMLRKVIVLAS
jgi:phage head maturation protease